jgi:iron(III) transport system ATP-binding protein
VIEQIGSPFEIYREPATAFVADFIGTMNFVAGVAAGPGKVRLGTVELACVADGLDQGVPITVAVRPEDIVIQNVTGEEENTFQARVESMEFLGSFYRADLVGEALGEARLRVDLSINLVRRMELNEGATVRVMMPSERIRIYPRGAAHD